MCKDNVAKDCTRGFEGVQVSGKDTDQTLKCDDGKCLCPEDTCYVGNSKGGQCVHNGCHVAAAQFAAIQAVGGITSPLAQTAALRAGKNLHELSLQENSGEKHRESVEEPDPEAEAEVPGRETPSGIADEHSSHNNWMYHPVLTVSTPVVVAKGHPHESSALKGLMSKLLQISKQLNAISDAAVMGGEDDAATSASSVAQGAAQADAAPDTENVQADSDATSAANPSAMPVIALLAASLAPPLPRRQRHSQVVKEQWSRFLTPAGMAA
jgi:hypothetical protein